MPFAIMSFISTFFLLVVSFGWFGYWLVGGTVEQELVQKLVVLWFCAIPILALSAFIVYLEISG